MAHPQGGSSAGEGAVIWILTWGTRGDHEPAAALALGLRDRGHRVKVFGGSRMRSMFDAYGLDYAALDGPPLVHPANSTTRGILEAQAEAEGFEGASRAEDYLFDSVLVQSEFVYRMLAQLHADGKPEDEIFKMMGELSNGIRHYLIVEKGLLDTPDTRRQYLEFLAAQAGKPVDEYMPAARCRRAAFHGLMQRVASKTGWEPWDTMRCLFNCFALRLARMCMELEDDKARRSALVQEQVSSFLAWQAKDAADLDSYLDAFWEEWFSELWPLESASPEGSSLPDLSAVGSRNVEMSFGSAAPGERPSLVVHHGLLDSAAMSLRAKHGVSTLHWSTMKPPATIKEMLQSYAFTLTLEGDFEGVPRPLRDGGPFPFVSLLQGERQLYSFTKLALDDSAAVQPIKACCTGQWVLDGLPLQPSGPSGSHFGSPEEAEALEAFLGLDDVPPVYMGWGSMPNLRGGAKALAELVAFSLKRVGRRGIIVSGWSGLTPGLVQEALSKEFGDGPAAEGRALVLKSASLATLLPRCACAVHHGGAGTCHTVLRAGVPAVVTPVMVDQFPNADWIESLGCGVKTGPLPTLQPEALASALEQVLASESIKAKAKELAAVVAEERGASHAVELIEGFLRKPAAAPAVAPAEAPEGYPWLDGEYNAYHGDFQLPVPPMTIRGGVAFSPDETPIGWLQAGQFVVQDDRDGNTPGSYEVRSAWPMFGKLSYGHVGDGGALLSWDDGSSVRLAAA